MGAAHQDDKERNPSYLPMNQNVDTVVGLHEENKRSERRTRRTLSKWLVFIFAMAWLRIFFFNFVQINNVDVQIENSRVKLLQRDSFVFGWLLFGNIADNAFDPKMYLIASTTCLGVYYICLGIYMWTTPAGIEEIDGVIRFMKDSFMVIYAGVQAFSMI